MKRLLWFATFAVILSACGASDTTARELPDISLDSVEAATDPHTVAGPGPNRAYNLWATWCPPCRAELPAFDAVAERRDDVEIIGVNVGEDRDDAQELVEELGLTFPQVLDPKAEIQRALRITGMPATIFVDDQGDVLRVFNGELTEAELEALLDELYGV